MQPRNISMSGVVDLSALKAAAEAKAKADEARAQRARQAQSQGPAGAQGQPAGEALRLIVDVDEQSFESEVLQRSAEVPVVIDFWAEWCQPCKQLSPVLERLTEALAGRVVLAKVDVDANPMLAQQFGVQGIPAVFAVVAGQALPLFQGAAPEAQIRQVLEQLIAAAEQRFGITGLAGAGAGAGEEAGAGGAVPGPPMDPALEAAYSALESGDLGGAIRAFENVLSDQPGHAEAKAGLANARLLERVRSMDQEKVRRDAADRPEDVGAQMAAADLDLYGGHVPDAFSRLVDAVRRSAGEEREKARMHLLELFEVVGPDDPRVTAARGALTRVLF
ncbi:tetratricopeptide repeat protein [Streptomyces sp. YIM 98790]|uniref:tetratricopeptide repeat protein n=1 Tax=Streptomyces sp. YIM 98790 TaxID=2689077 RepID=UPI001A9F5E7B|nr:tetratricopeptide repeat protein [Streptomyces sp. YIM 98790]